ncbi:MULTISPECIES: Trm112 family protein [unclassified Streptomyces]|uniref:Trm112 family protein n=1 Tax=unclassified Streptomyces TaxID=2593676 RepID=UPI0022B68A17|nr:MULTISPECIES: Trm112 family protein [unclassified Streptomyces]MCZ7414591.1 Trm112 family protein [Streptomyces sp. WMMC897]MCZ7431519.1 Trm112 family protein [Streptomyces sp. WMMC1477]
MPLEAGLLEILACPACHAPLREEPAPTGEPADAELVCTDAACGLAYPVRDGIPVLLVDEARRPA